MIGSLVSPRFVGRASELEHLLEAAERVRSGVPAAFLVSGEAGVGKSRLVTELSGRLEEQGWRVLTGECVELGGDGLPLAPLADILRTLVRTSTPDELEAHLGAARRELTWLLPELGDQPLAASSVSQAQLLELVLGVITRVGHDRPLLLVVEDLHWADRSTLELVTFLVRALRGAPVMVLMTYRSDELHRRHPLRPVLTTWERGRTVARLELARLTPGEVAEQLDGILGEAPSTHVAEAVFERSQGNAYLVEEVLGILQGGRRPDDLPPSLRDVLLTQMDLLPDDAQGVVRAASAAGTSVPEALLVAVVDLGPDELGLALREAVEHHLLVVDDTVPGYAFRHAMTRDAVYHEMLPGERVQLHASYGEALASRPELAGRAASSLLAHHWYAALDLPRALAAAMQAGRESCSHTPADALTHFERVLEVWPRVADAEALAGADHVEVLCAAADAAYDAGAVDRCLQLLDQALAEQPEAHGPERRATILETRAKALRDVGKEREGYAVLLDAVRLLPESPPSAARASLLASLANSTMRLGDMDECARYAEEGVAAARAAGAEVSEVDSLVSLGCAWVHHGEIQRGLECIRVALEQAKRLGAHATTLRAYINLSDALESQCEHEEAARVAREGQRHSAESGGLRIVSAYLASNAAEPLFRLGRWSEADRIATVGLEGDRDGVLAGTLLEVLAQLALHRGDHERARRLLGEAQAALGGDPDPQFTLPLAFIEAELARAQGDPGEALAVIGRVLDPAATTWPRYRWPLLWETSRCVADQRQRARDRGDDSAGDALSGVAPWVAAAEVVPCATDHARAYAALLTAEDAGTGADGGDAWATAVERCRTATDPYLVAYSTGRHAEAAVAAGDRDRATALLRESSELASELGAAPVLEAARQLARRARLALEETTPDQQVPAAAADAWEHFGLTARERDVLALIATGSANSDIARTLFISPKTVSVHVSNVLAKLQVRSRVEAAGVAHRNGLYGPPTD